MTTSGLSERHLEALRLDMEDERSGLIEEIYGMSRGLSEPVRAVSRAAGERLPRAIRPSPPAASAFDPARMGAAVERLYRIDQALKRMHHPDFGFCRTCGIGLGFELLAADPSRRHCRRCGGS